jgi:hypothetical protein
MHYPCSALTPNRDHAWFGERAMDNARIKKNSWMQEFE